jgi:hypothetical protein
VVLGGAGCCDCRGLGAGAFDDGFELVFLSDCANMHVANSKGAKSDRDFPSNILSSCSLICRLLKSFPRDAGLAPLAKD